ncbi:hypothetical protein BV133_2753 [Blastochloris viridis]|uniref:Uncharacterized protein n=1 Tax=Blastochloris viridis TaxID=1079 RepID=A0A182D4A8_BLAVI|nr:hypothetical protein BV133_2753 [Blastochloris viridis]
MKGRNAQQAKGNRQRGQHREQSGFDCRHVSLRERGAETVAVPRWLSSGRVTETALVID